MMRKVFLMSLFSFLTALSCSAGAYTTARVYCPVQATDLSKAAVIFYSADAPRVAPQFMYCQDVVEALLNAGYVPFAQPYGAGSSGTEFYEIRWFSHP